MSHDLRTPLTAITGYAESLADGVVPPEQAAEVGAIMLTEAQRLNRLVADLLDLARLDAQEFRIDLAPGRPHRAGARGRPGLVGPVRARPASGSRSRRRTGPLLVPTDPARLRQVLDGLLENALRVTPGGAPIVLAARGEYRADGHRSRWSRCATAARAWPSRIWRWPSSGRCSTSATAGVRQVGTGLGLAIVAGLVRRLGGTVEAGHAPEGGARFTVRLPA